MLFTYKYVEGHKIEKFQKYSDFLFLRVWSRARTPFDSSKFEQFEELKEKYESFDYLTDEKSWGYQFNYQIEVIYDEFLKLSKSQKKKLRYWYRTNNKVHGLFVNTRKVLVSYSMVEAEELVLILSTWSA